jgi:two-component system, cell cycle sensor histidine kinase and response regulator CckA
MERWFLFAFGIIELYMKSESRTDQPLRILHLEDNPTDSFLVARTLRAEGLLVEFVHARSRLEYEAALERPYFDLILSDYTIPGYTGMAALKAAQDKHPLTPFIFLSGTIGEQTAVESLKCGAVDYVLKSDSGRLTPSVRRALREAKEKAERLLHEQQLCEQAALLDLAKDAIIVTEMGGIVRYWSKGAERLHGWQKEEVLGQSTKEFLYHDLSWFEGAVKILHERGEWKGDVPKRTKSNGQLLMHTHWTLVRDTSGKPQSVLSISTDITAEKKLEEQLLRAQRMQSIGALAGGIAHDLNNIFSPILVATQVMAEDLSEDERKKMLDTVTGCAQRGAEMVGRILAFARGTGGVKQRLDTGAIVSEVARLLQTVLPRSIRLKIVIDPDLPPVLGNSTQLHQILMNLCVNGRDAMSGGGELSVSAKLSILQGYVTRWELQPVSGQFVTLSVSDAGCGMSSAVLERIFEPFFTTKGPEKGTGLGLATVRGIVRNHGGFVEIFTEPGKGTTVRVHLPVSQA